MSWFTFGRKRRPATSAAPPAAETAAQRLQRRVQACTDAQDPRAALETAALEEASVVLDEHLGLGPDLPEVVDPGALMAVAVLHRIRAGALGNPIEERQAVGALQVVVHVLDPAGVPPMVRDEVADAIGRGQKQICRPWSCAPCKVTPRRSAPRNNVTAIRAWPTRTSARSNAWCRRQDRVGRTSPSG
ncbi:hypothetical protein [Actinoplanes sp. NPDC051859]|uniref:hypothetical protein n=1 Tax=Actinoplanes sp. NPDC051859 TaxID=3363909 RepID=UPI003787DB2D